MKRGPKPTPTALKRLRGFPGKRGKAKDAPKHEPRPPAPAELTIPSSWLPTEAQDEWRRIAPTLMTLGLLTLIDRATLEGYCMAYYRWRQAEEVLEKEGMVFRTPKGYVQQRPEVSIAQGYLAKMHSLAAEFGFTPASRTRVVSAEKPLEDPYQAYLAEGQRRGAPAKAAPVGRA